MLIVAAMLLSWPIVTNAAELNWQLKYEQLAKQHVQLLEEAAKLRSLVTTLSASVARQDMIDKTNQAAVLKRELKQIDESKKAKTKEAEE